ncbi:MAG: hypothetical protein SO034_00615, partial [Staphylococcus hyicus]|uniref:hypothetical protein n=1 Tax=Staphylococcus hyicus TaxID=1284 RepID=UPI002A8019D3
VEKWNVNLLVNWIITKQLSTIVLLSCLCYFSWLYNKYGAWRKIHTPVFIFLYTKRQISNIIKVQKNKRKDICHE